MPNTINTIKPALLLRAILIVSALATAALATAFWTYRCPQLGYHNPMSFQTKPPPLLP